MYENLDLGCQWHFLKFRKGSEKRGKEDASFNPFSGHEVRCLVREYIQNSLDAAQKIDEEHYKRVRVDFTFGELECSQYPALIQSLLGRLKACSERCQELSQAKDTFKSKYEYLKSRYNGKLGFLKVSDYNTTGMDYIDDDITPSAFDSCVQSSSASFKQDGRAGGSQGLGKTVGFVNSKINAVYYSTMHDETGHTFGEGVVKLNSHVFEDETGIKCLYDPVAFYNKDGHPNSKDEIPVVFRRDVPGTDAFVLGMEETEECVKKMKEELIRSFFYTIWMDKLEVYICGEHFCKDNLVEQILKYFPDSNQYSHLDTDRSRDPEISFNPRPYLFEIAMRDTYDEEHQILSTDDFPEQFPNLGHATFQIWKNDDIKTANAPDKIIFMRNKLMTIEVRKPRGSRGFYGIIICDGCGDNYLRMMEDITHDHWKESELKDTEEELKRKVQKVYKELNTFRDECIKKFFPQIHNKEMEIHSLKKRKIGKFGQNDEEREIDEIWPTSNDQKKESDNKREPSTMSIIEGTPGRKKKKKKGTRTDTPPEVDPVPHDEPGPEPGPGPKPGPGPEPKPTTYVEGEEGEDDGIGQTENPKAYREIEIKLDGNSKRLKPLRDGTFASQLEIRVSKNYDDCRLVMNIQADRGEFPLDIKYVSEGYKIRDGIPNEIYGFDLKADVPNVIKFTPQENVRYYSLIVKIYGH